MINKQTLSTALEGINRALQNEIKLSDCYSQLLVIDDWALDYKLHRDTETERYFAKEAILIDTHKLVDNPLRFYFVGAYLYANTIENHIAKLCTDVEGAACSADKSHAILSKYLEHIKSGLPPSWEPLQQGCYWLPRFGEPTQWFDFIKAIIKLQHGDPTSYLETRQALVDASNPVLVAMRSIPSLISYLEKNDWEKVDFPNKSIIVWAKTGVEDQIITPIKCKTTCSSRELNLYDSYLNDAKKTLLALAALAE